jgi:glycosyltransferase involved in cell wall biosynthesis
VRICLIGLKSQRLDEGVQKVGYHLAQGLSRRHPVLFLDVRKVYTPGFWKEIRRFKPHIVNSALGSTLPSFLLMKALHIYNGTKTAMLVLQPSRYLFLWRRVISWLKPDLILAQSADIQEFFARLGCRIEFLPNGVDTARFTPVSRQIKEALREKYGVEKKKFVILHVGPLARGRNLSLLQQLQGGQNQVLVVGSTSLKKDARVCRELTATGCLVWTAYFPSIEEIYALSDCYVFPTLERGESIELPLSVMEAMACNLPVVSTRFGALPRVFPEGGGLFFVDKPEDIPRYVEELGSSSVEIKTREKVLPYSWESIVDRLERIYEGLLSRHGGKG